MSSLHGRRGKSGCPEAPFPTQAGRRGLAEGAAARSGLGGSRGSRFPGMRRSQLVGAAGWSDVSVPGKAKSLAYTKLDFPSPTLGFLSWRSVGCLGLVFPAPRDMLSWLLPWRRAWTTQVTSAVAREAKVGMRLLLL